jgi:hypothetical protein
MLKVLVLGALVVSALASASSASATNWTSNGTAAGVTYSGTGSGSLLVIHGPNGNVGVTCTTSTTTNAKLFGPTGPANTGTWSAVSTLTPTFGTCKVAGVAATVSCGTANLNAVSQSGVVVSGNLSSINCTITRSTCVITVAPTTGGATGVGVQGTYNNNTGVLVVAGGFPSTQTLTASWTGDTVCDTIFGTTTGGTGASYFGSQTQTTVGYPDSLSYTVSAFAPFPGKPQINHN